MRLLSSAWAVLALFASAPSFAQSIVDTTAAGAILDGAASDAEYPAHTVGTNSGFGGPLGLATLGVDGDPFGNLTWALYGGVNTCAGNDIVVIYLDTNPGGFGSTAPLVDTGDLHRAAISAVGADLTFAPGFEADYAIAFNTTFAGLWKLEGTTHTFVRPLTAAAFGGCNQELSGMTLADVGLAPGDDFKHVATLINGSIAFRSDEFHGATVPNGNIGTTSLTLGANEFVTFSSFFIVINEVDSDTPSTDVAEFVELKTRPSADLSALSLTYLNGSNDLSYFSTALLTADANGYFVVGNAGVAPDITTNNGSLQNGQDAVALYLAAPLANNTAPTATNLVDLVVYDTNDPDDAQLLALFPTAQPQVNEGANNNSDTESIQRCAGGALVTQYLSVAIATPRAANTCQTCAADVDCGSCQVCNQTVGLCEAGADNTTCDDGDACTETDVCVSGVCGGAAKDCSGSDGTCAVGTCNAGTGACEALPVADNTTCDDGDACTETDVCTAGSCGGTTKDCSGLDAACAVGTCNAGTGACEVTVLADTTACDDADACTENDVCSSGVCGGATKDCSGLDAACAVGTCNSGTGACEATVVADNTTCDDGDVCTETDVCSSGVCGGATKDCSGLDGVCAVGTCNAGTGACEATTVADNSTCDDGSLCTESDVCIAGVCAGTTKDCSGLNSECSTGVCDANTGQCVDDTFADGSACNDSNPCTESDTCSAGTCSGTLVAAGTACGDQCNTGMCDGLTGACTQTPVADNTPCDDTEQCTASDVCTSGVCAGVVVNDGSACDDGEACTEEDTCVAGVCSPGVDICVNADVGTSDSGTQPGDDVGTADSGTEPGDDAGTPGSKGTVSGDGCGCVTTDAPHLDLSLWLLVLGLVALRRRGQ